MLNCKQFLAAILIILALIFSAFTAVADISSGNTIINTTINGNVTGNSNSNVATNFSDSNVVPQRGDDSTVYDNHVTIENGGSAFSVYGGNSDGDVSDNSVEISGMVNNDVYGGCSRGVGDVSDNNVAISGTVDNDVYGGFVGHS